MTKYISPNISSFSTVTINSPITNCIKLVKQFLPVSINAMYTNAYFKEIPKDTIRLVMSIQRQLKRTIKRSDWLDSATKIQALEKINEMTVQIGYPEEYLNNTKIERYYKGLDLNENFTLFESVMILDLFKTNRKFKQLKKQAIEVLKVTHGSKRPKYSDVIVANAIYDNDRNAVCK